MPNSVYHLATEVSYHPRDASRGGIRAVESAKTRSLLRGLLVKDVDSRVLLTYDNLRSSTSFDDIEQVCTLLLSSPLFAHLPITDAFPASPQNSGRRLHRPTTQPLTHEIVFQTIRFRLYENRLTKAITDLHSLNRAILVGHTQVAVARAQSFIHDYGYSLVILSKLAYLRARHNDDSDVKGFCEQELARYGVTDRNVIGLGAVDMMGESYAFIPLRRNILEFASSKGVSPFTQDVVNWQFRPICTIRDDLSSKLLSLGISSLLDAALLLLTHRFNVPVIEDLGLAPLVDKYLPLKLVDAWRSLCGDGCPAAAMTFEGDEPCFNDFTFYRRSLAWIEYKSVSRFRLGADSIFRERSLPAPPTSPLAAQVLREYFQGVGCLADIAEAPGSFNMDLTSFHNGVAGTFLRTLAFIHLLRGGARGADVSAEQLLSLLNWTRDISVIATHEELRSFFATGQPNLIAQYLAAALISDSSGLNIDQHRLRRSLQEVLLKHFSGDLVSFAAYLRREHSHVARHLFDTCTEGFLTQLFLLFSDADAVLETRARLLEWYAAAFDEPSTAERAKTLRLDQKLRKVRGEIDDTRIYVDSLRFGQWLEDNLLEELSGAFRSGPIESARVDEFKGFSDFATNRQPHLRLALALQAAFNEFCANKRYGVDSYLGRRIRHGTLKGVMLVQLQAVLRKPKFATLMARKESSALLSAWVGNYEAEVVAWSQDTFQIRSKQKLRGAIHPEIITHAKIDTARAAVNDLARIYTETVSLASVNHAIIEWCWRLIEKDLAALRASIDAARVSWGTLDARTLRQVCDADAQSLAAELCREVNALADEKFRTLARWFSKPTNLAPSATLSLLIDAVTDEVRDHFPEYSPDVRRTGLPDVELFGMHYHHVYDFLYVVIYNAAKHGHPGGVLAQEIVLERAEGQPALLQLIVTSQVRPTDTIEAVRANILAAMGESLEDAMVVEKRSGLRKLLRLAIDVREIEAVDVSFGDRTVSFRCALRIPMT